MAKKNSVIKTVAAVVVTLAIVCGVGAGAYALGKYIQTTPDTEQTQPKDDDAEKTPGDQKQPEDGGDKETSDSGGLIVTPKSAKAMKLTANSLKANAGEASNGVTAQTDNSYILTAKVINASGESPDYLQSVVYSTSWSTEKSASIADFLEMTVTGNTATLSAKQPFDTQIIITCTSALDSTITATATLDYLPRITTVNIGFYGRHTVSDGDRISVEISEDMNKWRTIDLDTDFQSYTFGIGSLDGSSGQYIKKITLEIGPNESICDEERFFEDDKYSGELYDLSCEDNPWIEFSLFFNDLFDYLYFGTEDELIDILKSNSDQFYIDLIVECESVTYSLHFTLDVSIAQAAEVNNVALNGSSENITYTF